MAEHGWFHPDRGYWQTTDYPAPEYTASYPDGTTEVPLKPGAGYELNESLEWVLVPPALDAVQAARIESLRASCSAAIVGGFSSDALGAAHTYPSDQTAQLNLMGSVTDSLLPELPSDWTTPFWCEDSEGAWAFRPHTALQIRQAGRDGKAHVVICQTTLDALTAEVLAATSVQAVNAVTWPQLGGGL